MGIILATYVDSTHFSIEGEYTTQFPLGRVVTLYQGDYGTATTSVINSSYSAATGLTTIEVKATVVLTYLVSIKRGPSCALSVGRHGHTSENDGGYKAASRFSDANVDVLLSITSPVMIWKGPWLELTDYTYGHTVSYLGHLFVCTLPHESSEAEEPLVGLYWEDYWDQAV